MRDGCAEPLHSQQARHRPPSAGEVGGRGRFFVSHPERLIDEHGDIAWRTRSTLWGATAWADNSTTYTPLRLPGQYYDPETGLHYNYCRRGGSCVPQSSNAYVAKSATPR
ncbi:hypothetical protein TNCT1_36210 [Streptomyces sp. 1-11]|nr:hypothetical protein TNCT1_36210 [Streptomyces sp. 1-11]